MKILLKTTALLYVLIITIASVKAQDNIKEHKVVIQLNSADTAVWNSTIGNIKNLQKIWPDQLKIEVVIHGKALGFALKEKTHVESELKALMSGNLRFIACENTMKKQAVTKDMLVSGIETVPSGVAEIILKQELGWAYLKTN
jgi:intracellular sulfur oxidation DsrE/DsrF family protein